MCYNNYNNYYLPPPSAKTIKTLQGDQQYNLAEEIQRILSVSVVIQTALTEQQAANVEMQDEVEDAVGKVAAAFQLSQTDQDTIVRLKEEIGKTVESYFLHFYIRKH